MTLFFPDTDWVNLKKYKKIAKPFNFFHPEFIIHIQFFLSISIYLRRFFWDRCFWTLTKFTSTSVLSTFSSFWSLKNNKAVGPMEDKMPMPACQHSLLSTGVRPKNCGLLSKICNCFDWQCGLFHCSLTLGPRVWKFQKKVDIFNGLSR